jgi:hypothetical protein
MQTRFAARGVYVLLLPAAKRVCIVVLQRDRAAPRDLFTVVAEDLWGEAVSAAAESASDEGEGKPTHTASLLPDLSEYAVTVRTFGLMSNLSRRHTHIQTLRPCLRRILFAFVGEPSGARPLSRLMWGAVLSGYCRSCLGQGAPVWQHLL